MSDERKYYDQEGNECSLDKLCRLEPEWAANRLRVAEDAVEKLRALCAALPEGVMVCSASREKAAIASQWLADVRAAGQKV
jgi:hypothetical protein